MLQIILNVTNIQIAFTELDLSGIWTEEKVAVGQTTSFPPGFFLLLHVNPYKTLKNVRTKLT